MRPIGHPDFVYTPWSKERRAAASEREKKRRAGMVSIAKYCTDDKVWKKGAGYQGPGKVEAVVLVDGDFVYIVSHKIEGGEGKLLHLYRDAQLEPLGGARKRR